MTCTSARDSDSALMFSKRNVVQPYTQSVNTTQPSVILSEINRSDQAFRYEAAAFSLSLCMNV